jgi:ankyrin repeat protein
VLGGPHDRTALHEAAANCQFAAAKILVDHGWNRQAADDQKRPPVNLITIVRTRRQHRQSNLVAMLVRMGTDVNAVGPEGNRALELSCLHGDAATAGFLLEHGANPNLHSKVGSTPVHDAALTGNKEVVELVLERGANINAVDSDSASTPCTVPRRSAIWTW